MSGSVSFTERTDDSSVAMVVMGSFMRRASLKSFQPIGADDKTLAVSLWAVRFALFADAASMTILYPNYAFLVTPGASGDSFESTSPFGFGGATYFLPMMALFAAAITSCFMGTLSDRFGRRPCMLICLGVSVFLTIGKYLAKGSFWGFSAANFVNGLFAGTLPVSLTYASDVSTCRRAKEVEMGYMIAIYTVGWRFGGITTILLGDYGLFTPLLIGALMNAVATVALVFFMIEPREVCLFGANSESEDEDEANSKTLETLNKPIFANIYLGSVLDAIGNNAAYPLVMTPLAFNTFLGDFLAHGQIPVMSPTAYRWCCVMIGITALIGSALARPLYRVTGIPLGVVLGNVITAVGPIVCLFISQLTPTTLTMSIFVTIVYIVFPFIIMNKLGIGLMLDRISPAKHRGFVQGLNVTLYNFSMAVTPFAFGAFSDALGVSTMIWTVSGIALFGAIAKIPLMFVDDLKNKPPNPVNRSTSEFTDHTLKESSLDAELGCIQEEAEEEAESVPLDVAVPTKKSSTNKEDQDLTCETECSSTNYDDDTSDSQASDLIYEVWHGRMTTQVSTMLQEEDETSEHSVDIELP